MAPLPVGSGAIRIEEPTIERTRPEQIGDANPTFECGKPDKASLRRSGYATAFGVGNVTLTSPMALP